MKQLVFIHGGTLAKDNDALYELLQTREINLFEERKRWRQTLQEKLPDFQVIQPQMPNKDMASYKIWKLWFEKHFPFFSANDFTLVGHSLGGMFLIKYLGENGFPFKIKQLHLVAPVLDDEGLQPGDDYLGDFAYDKEIINNLNALVGKIYLRHSKDDPVVPFSHSEQIKYELPNAHFMIFEDKGHFSIPEFPEFIQIVQKG